MYYQNDLFSISEEYNQDYSITGNYQHFPYDFSPDPFLNTTYTNTKVSNFHSELNDSNSLDIFNDIPERENQAKENKRNLSKFLSLDEIIKDYIQDEEIKMKLNEGKSIENLCVYKFLELGNKKGLKKCLSINIENEEKKLGKKKGRKKQNQSENYVHDKMKNDNIIKKLKSYLINTYILNFLNKIIKNIYPYDEIKLFKIDYKYINELKKEKELNYLKMTLKQLYSQNISPKKIYHEKDYNKKIIEELIKKNDTINFVFNLTYKDFIELFIHKKTIYNIKDFHNTTNHIDYEVINNNLPKVEELLCDLLRKNNDLKYSILVVFYLFNLERALQLMQTRVKK